MLSLSLVSVASGDARRHPCLIQIPPPIYANPLHRFPIRYYINVRLLFIQLPELYMGNCTYHDPLCLCIAKRGMQSGRSMTKDKAANARRLSIWDRASLDAALSATQSTWPCSTLTKWIWSRAVDSWAMHFKASWMLGINHVIVTYSIFITYAFSSSFY